MIKYSVFYYVCNNVVLNFLCITETRSTTIDNFFSVFLMKSFRYPRQSFQFLEKFHFKKQFSNLHELQGSLRVHYAVI